MSYITKIDLENFTSFASFSQEFDCGVNVFIGANGTGKTHLLKLLYSACAITEGEGLDQSFSAKVKAVFSPYEGRIGRLSRRKGKSVSTKITVHRQTGKKIAISFTNHTKLAEEVKGSGGVAWKQNLLSSAYIPVKEMLAHAPGFLSTVAKREISFEEVYADIVKKAYLPKLKGTADKNRKTLLESLQKIIEGKVIAKGEHFFLKNAQGDLEFSLLAEGIRKLALIWLLIQNGTFARGSVLFWDEPEANLNPSLMGKVVEIILELQRQGVQVFLATHNYVLLKEFDLRKKETDVVRYVSLERGADGVQGRSTHDYVNIQPNALSATFDDLYNRELSKSFGAKL